jgi:hypothetical protein
MPLSRVVSEFVVDIKRSARRANGVVGDIVHRRGPRRRFEAREDAERWAAGLTANGDRKVWIRAANPDDRTGADAYLVSRRRPRGAGTSHDPADGEQSGIPRQGES